MHKPQQQHIFVRPIHTHHRKRHNDNGTGGETTSNDRYWVDFGSNRAPSVRSSSDFEFLRNSIQQSYEGIVCPPLPSTCSDIVSSISCEVIEEISKDDRRYFIARYFERFLRRLWDRTHKVKFDLLEKFFTCTEADWRIVKNDYGEVEPVISSPGWLSNLLVNTSSTNEERSLAVRDVLKAQRDVLRAQKRLSHSLQNFGCSIKMLGMCCQGGDVIVQFGRCVEMNRNDMNIVSDLQTSFSLVESLGERDSLVKLEILVNARIRHFNLAYKRVNDELYRANAALCRIRQSGYRERRESDEDSATLTRRVDELSARAMTRRNSAETVRTLLMKSMHKLQVESNVHLLTCLRDWAKVQAHYCMKRRTNLENFYMSIYDNNDKVVDTSIVSRRLDLCLVEARNVRVAEEGGLLNISFALCSSSSTVSSSSSFRRFRAIRMENKDTKSYIFGQIISFGDVHMTTDRLYVVASDDCGRYIGSVLISLKDLRGADRWWSLETATCGEIRIRVTRETTNEKYENKDAVDEMGFRVPKRYVGMLHYCSLESCMMSRQLKRWCKFGSGSLDRALSRISASKKKFALPPEGIPWTLRQDTRELLWGGLPSSSSMRRNCWFVLSGADRIESESKKTYESYLQDQVDVNVRNAVEADCVRTFTSHLTSADKNALQRVLLAHASRNPHIGYAQGLNHVAGFVMSISEFSERDTFWILSALTERLCRGYYTQSMFGLRRDFNVLRELVHQQHPDVLRHLDNLGAPLAVFVTGSFLSHFVLHLPSHTLLRVMDITMWLGSAGLIVGVLALIDLHSKHLLRAQSLAQVKEVWQEIERRCYDTEIFIRAMQRTWLEIDNGAGPINRFLFLRKRHESRIAASRDDEE